MNLKRKAQFSIKAYGKDKDMFLIRLRVTFDGSRLDFNTGKTIAGKAFWNEEIQMVSEGYTGPKGETALNINNDLRNIRDQIESTFKYFEANDTFPTMEQIKDKFLERMKGITPKRAEPTLVKAKEPGFITIFDEFMTRAGEKNAWTVATYGKMKSLKTDLLEFDKKIALPTLTESKLTDFVVFLRDKKQLRTPRKPKGERDKYDEDDIVGLKNSTINKKLGYLNWFLNWAEKAGYNVNNAYKNFRPTLKQTQKKVIYLTKDELLLLQNLHLTETTAYLDSIRDVFLFCCFTGLRFSDACNLKRTDIKGEHIDVTTIKTADSVSIELNATSRAILEKYKDERFTGNLALPVCTNQDFNRNIKTLCRLAGIDEEIRITTYKGNERRDDIKQKWELIGSHTGRRTFIVNALSMGIPPQIVMKWTGHASYSSMQPYIDIVDSTKSSEMEKFNSLL